jgi:hypothetical protein
MAELRFVPGRSKIGIFHMTQRRSTMNTRSMIQREDLPGALPCPACAQPHGHRLTGFSTESGIDHCRCSFCGNVWSEPVPARASEDEREQA